MGKPITSFLLSQCPVELMKETPRGVRWKVWTSHVPSDQRVERWWSHGAARISIPKPVCSMHPCHWMGIHSTVLLVSGSSHRCMQAHHSGADSANGAGMLSPPTQGHFWLSRFLRPFSHHSSFGFCRFSAVGTSPGLSPTLFLPSGKDVLFGEGGSQELGAGNADVIWICYS